MAGRIRETLKKMARVFRGDSWENTTTGLGTSRDKRQAGAFIESPLIPQETLEALFDGDALAARIVQLPVDEALRQGIDISLQSDEGEGADFAKNQQMEADIHDAWSEIKLVENLHEATTWGRLFGGAVIFPVIEDSGLVTEQLVMENIKRVHSLLVIDCRSIYPATYNDDPRSPRFGEAETYQIVHTQGQGGQTFIATVHASRVIPFDGVLTTERGKPRNNGWSFSVLQRVFDALREFNAGFDSSGVLLTEASIGILKMKGLIEGLSDEGGAEIRTRLELMDEAKGVVRSLVLDADGDESFTREAVQFGSIPDLLDRFAQRLAASTGMPMTVLMGISPGGLNSIGESDLKLWENTIQSVQTLKIQTPLEIITEMLMSSTDGPTGGKVPDNWDAFFPPIRQQTQEQIAELRAKVAVTDKTYFDIGSLSGAQIALNRFGKGGYSMETTIDVDAVEEEAAADLEEAKRRLLPPVDPDPSDPDMPPEVTAGLEKAGVAALALTGTAQGAIIKVNEGRAASNLGDLTKPDGTRDPDGDLTIAAFIEKLKGEVAAATEAAKAGNQPPAPVLDQEDTPDHFHKFGDGKETGPASSTVDHSHSLPGGGRTTTDEFGAGHTHTLPDGTETEGPKAVEAKPDE